MVHSVRSGVADKILLPNDTIIAKFSANNFAMLTTLRIKNLALVADMTLELQARYRSMLGQSAANKFLPINAVFGPGLNALKEELGLSRS